MAGNSGISLLCLSHDDNVLVALGRTGTGRARVSDGSVVEILEPVTLGQKIARSNISAGEKIIKYGVAIGSATDAIKSGQHVHVHNMKSDYTPTYALDETVTGDTDA